MNWKKLHDDLLLETEGKRKGKYSRKSIIMVVSFLIAIFICIFILIAYVVTTRTADPM